LWERFFQRDPHVVGRAILFDSKPATVIGVMPSAMNSPQGTDAWFPIMRRSDNPGWMNRANHPMMFGWGRLKLGVSVAQARTEIKTIAARLEKQYPETNAGVTAEVKPLLENLVGGYRKNLTFLLGAVALVLVAHRVLVRHHIVVCALEPGRRRKQHVAVPRAVHHGRSLLARGHWMRPYSAASRAAARRLGAASLSRMRRMRESTATAVIVSRRAISLLVRPAASSAKI
jgi:putative ABC transport system permease protein